MVGLVTIGALEILSFRFPLLTALFAVLFDEPLIVKSKLLPAMVRRFDDPLRW